ncbi:hypothetical protein DYH11_01025 [Candidatus Microgenomates bacterium CPR3]|nr:hypothetical protein [Candidatus Microgenomates bacterium CPR3]
MKTYSDQLDKILTEYLVKKAPILPKSVKNFLVSVAPYFALLGAILGVQVVLSALAIKPLFARRAHGWRLMYYSQLLSVILLVRGLSLGSLVMTILSFYILYQVKASYGAKK